MEAVCAAGKPVADVLDGTKNPRGHLTFTIPRHVGQLPLYYDHKTGSNHMRQRTLAMGAVEPKLHDPTNARRIAENLDAIAKELQEKYGVWGQLPQP